MIEVLTGKCEMDFEELLDSKWWEEDRGKRLRLHVDKIDICEKCYSIDMGKGVLTYCPRCGGDFVELPILVYKFSDWLKSDKFILEKIARLFQRNWLSELDLRFLEIKWSGLKSEKDMKYTKDSVVYNYDEVTFRVFESWERSTLDNM